jgi:hypothetical protein
MFAIFAAVAYRIGFVENGSGGHTSVWFSPTAMLLLGSFLLALHLAGAGAWLPRR